MLSRREINLYLPEKGPFALLFDNLKAPVPAEEAEEKKRAIAEAVSCGDPVAVRRVVIPSSISPWRRSLIHGGLVEFSCQEAMIRALRDVSFPAIENDSRLALQLPTLLHCEGWNLKYDLESELGAVPFDPANVDYDGDSGGGLSQYFV